MALEPEATSTPDAPTVRFVCDIPGCDTVVIVDWPMGTALPPPEGWTLTPMLMAPVHHACPNHRGATT